MNAKISKAKRKFPIKIYYTNALFSSQKFARNIFCAILPLYSPVDIFESQSRTMARTPLFIALITSETFVDRRRQTIDTPHASEKRNSIKSPQI